MADNVAPKETGQPIQTTVSVWDQIGPSIIRTIVPVFAGALITWALKAGFHLSNGATLALTTTVVTTVYYAAARWLETHAKPFVRLLGQVMLTAGFTAKKPTY